jgi:hypothetical protein
MSAIPLSHEGKSNTSCNVRAADKVTGEPDVCWRSTRNCTERGVWEPKFEDKPTGTGLHSKLIFSQLLLSGNVLMIFTHGKVQIMIRKISELEIVSALKCNENYFYKLDILGSMHHNKFLKEKSNKMQQCIKILLFHIYMKVNMFRATRRPSSRA